MPRAKHASTAEVTELAERCLYLARFIYHDAPPGHLARYEAAIEAAVGRTDLRGLKLMARDLSETARELPPSHQAQLDAELREKFGAGLKEDADAERRKARAAAKRGIRNGAEYEIVQRREEAIHADPAAADELRMLNEALTAYDEKKDAAKRRSS